LGYCYIQVGQYEAAQEILQRLLEIVATIENKTTASRCFFKLGFAAELQGDLTAAMSHYQTSYSTHPYPEPLIGLARIYNRQQKRDLAQLMAQDGQQLLAAEPFSPLFDFTLEWNTLLDLRGAAALAGAHQWILKMLTSLPPTVDYWRSAARRQLIQSVRKFGTLG
jgi:tetratricopeptide (TPR) repeat protein